MNTHHVSVIMGEVERVPFAWLTVEDKGCCEVRLSGDCAGLRRMFVRGEKRRQKVGAALFKKAIEIARAYQMRSLAFTVEKQNTVAIRFYEAQGARCFADDGGDWWMAFLIK